MEGLSPVVQQEESTSISGMPSEENAVVADLVRDLVGRVSFWSQPLLTEDNFFSLDYRKAPSVGSVGSAPSVDGSELGDLSDLDPSLLESGEDSDREFERLQQYTSKVRVENFKKEHPNGVPEKKRLRTEIVIDTSDLANEYDALPPLEQLSIHCEEDIPLEVVGHVTSVVDCLVVIESDGGVALDFDSVLFDEDRNSIGVVFDLFGPVRSPFYSVRFNTKEEAAKTEIGKKVYYAPKADQYTKTVIETQLQKQTDLDESISDDEAMFSDDEKEKEYRSRKAGGAKTSQVDNPTENNKKSGKRNRVQFSDSTVPQRGRGRGAHPHGRGRGGSWNWHSGRGGFSNRGQHHRRGQNNGSASAVGPSVANTDSPYAEWGCYGGIPFTDSRQL